MEEFLLLRLKRFCVKVFCFDGFFFLYFSPFLSAVVVNGQTVQFFWHRCCCNKIEGKKILMFFVCFFGCGDKSARGLLSHLPLFFKGGFYL